MGVICDGEVLYDGGIHTSFESATCQYVGRVSPHMILRSDMRNGKRLVIVEEPDFGGAVYGEVPSMYTAKVLAELDDLHTSDGFHGVTLRHDGNIGQVLSKDGLVNKDWPEWVDFLVSFYLEQ